MQKRYQFSLLRFQDPEKHDVFDAEQFPYASEQILTIEIFPFSLDICFVAMDSQGKAPQMHPIDFSAGASSTRQ
jgi:hypothetical protein